MNLLILFLVFLKIGFFAIGGAYSFLPLLEKDIVVKYQWLTKEEFLDVLGMIKIFPGAISIKFATYTGYKIAGIPGLVVTNLGNFIGPAIFIFLASKLYSRFKDLAPVKDAFNMIQLAVFTMLIALAFQLLNFNQLRNINSILIIAGSFLLFYFTKCHPVFIILGAGVAGVFLGR